MTTWIDDPDTIPARNAARRAFLDTIEPVCVEVDALDIALQHYEQVLAENGCAVVSAAHISALEAERDEAREDWLRRHREAGDHYEARLAAEKDRDAKRAEVDELLYLRAEDEALIRNLEAERDAAYARGLERAAEIVVDWTTDAFGLKCALQDTIAAALRSELARHQLPDGEAKPATEAE